MPHGLVDRFVGRRVLVVGDAMLDSYLVGDAERLSREAPVPIVAVERHEDAPGGAANAAANLAALGADIRLLSVVGDDPQGNRLRTALGERGVGVEAVIGDPNRDTLAKERVVAGGQMLVRLDRGSVTPMSTRTTAELCRRLEKLHGLCDGVLISDYGYGVAADALVGLLVELQEQERRLLVVDAKEPERFARLHPDATKPNYAEAIRLLGARSVDLARRPEQVAAGAHRILDRCGARMAAVTIDSDGCVLLEHGQEPYRTYTRPTINSRAAGAGDTFAAALTLALSSGATGQEAVESAQAAAAIAVGEDGTTTCTGTRLVQELSHGADALTPLEEVASRVDALRRRGKRIVFTNGGFDILHRGHVSYLSRAKALGDVLVVGLNTDEGVRRLKGLGRPINSLEDRASVLSALSCVDAIVPFAEGTPEQLIGRLRPDLYVKGGDYALEDLPERAAVEAHGGSVEILPLVEERSTTSIIDRIRMPPASPPSATRPRTGPRAPAWARGP